MKTPPGSTGFSLRFRDSIGDGGEVARSFIGRFRAGFIVDGLRAIEVRRGSHRRQPADAIVALIHEIMEPDASTVISAGVLILAVPAMVSMAMSTLVHSSGGTDRAGQVRPVLDNAAVTAALSTYARTDFGHGRPAARPARTTVTIPAVLNRVTGTAKFTLVPPRLSVLALSPRRVVGGQSTTNNTVALNGPAPAEGVTVCLTSGNTVASLPASVTVPAGAMVSPAFTITTTKVSGNTSVAITASYGGVDKAASLAVEP